LSVIVWDGVLPDTTVTVLGVTGSVVDEKPVGALIVRV